MPKSFNFTFGDISNFVNLLLLFDKYSSSFEIFKFLSPFILNTVSLSISSSCSTDIVTSSNFEHI